MALSFFEDKLRSEYWVRGSIWEFDWYIDVFFAEAAAFGKFPFHLGYEQAVLGDEFLNPSAWEDRFKTFSGLIDDLNSVRECAANYLSVLERAEKLMARMERGETCNLEEYKEVQEQLSLLMSSVTLVFDPLFSRKIGNIAEDERLTAEGVFGYVVDKSAHTALNESNLKLLELHDDNRREVERCNFEISKLRPGLRVLLENHARKYGWINTGEKGSREWTAANFLDQLRTLVSVSSKKIRAERQVTFRDAHNKEIVDLMILVNSYDNKAADQQIRLDFLFQRELKRRLGKDYGEQILENLTFDEIISVLDHPGLIERFSSRTENRRAVWQENGSLGFHYFSRRQDFERVVGLVSVVTAGDAISGSVACKGRVRGKVRVIKSQKDLEKFTSGEIMVAEKTQPKYVPFMAMAAAIVTDIGGVTSHAAIISREFEIPCIVGTGNATRILKTGEHVFVDAESGTVTKLVV